MKDLRVIKTQKAIEEAFLELRKEKDLDKIKVNELCSIAMINKTTFYNYYDDINALSQQLENKYLEECFFGFSGYKSLIQDTENFILGIYKSFLENYNIQILFKNRVSSLVEKAQEKVFEIYKNEIKTEEIKMRLMFLIQGAFCLLFNYDKTNNTNEKLKIIIEYAKSIWK